MNTYRLLLSSILSAASPAAVTKWYLYSFSDKPRSSVVFVRTSFINALVGTMMAKLFRDPERICCLINIRIMYDFPIDVGPE